MERSQLVGLAGPCSGGLSKPYFDPQLQIARRCEAFVSTNMVPIRKRIYESLDNGHVAISKLDWKVEKVRRLTNPFLNNSTVDTTKPWVGRIEKETNDFEITRTSCGLFSSNIPCRGSFRPVALYGK